MGGGTTPHSNPSYESADGDTPPLKQSASKVMAFQFTKSTFSAQEDQDWSFESVGILKSLPAMKTKNMVLTKKNLKGDKRVTLQIFPKSFSTLADAIEADSVENLPCTLPLSKQIRAVYAQKIPLTRIYQWLAGLEIQQNPDTKRYFLFSEKGDGEGLPHFAIAEAKKESVTFDELLANAV